MTSQNFSSRNDKLRLHIAHIFDFLIEIMKISSKDDQEDEVRLEKIILTTVFVALGIGGFVLSTLWSYSTHLTLKDAKTDQTKLIIKNLLYLFIIGM